MSDERNLIPDLRANATRPRKVFLSGHSLTDDPLGEYLERIAASLGDEMIFEEQILPGSSIALRNRETPETSAARPKGLSLRDRSGRFIDAAEEIAHPKDGRPYDALVVTERHDLAGVLVWDDTVAALRELHDRFVAANPKGRTYFYESWLDVEDKGAPRSWLDYERKARVAWRCVLSKVNASLAREGRADRILEIPAGFALAELVERATTGGGVAGLPRGNVRGIVDAFLEDDVHPTPLGRYYLALVVYAGLFGRSPLGAWAPEGVAGETATELQKIALTALERASSESLSLSLSECREHFRERFLDDYWDYVKAAYWSKEQSGIGAFLKRTRFAWEWKHRRFTEGSHNPLSDPE